MVTYRLVNDDFLEPPKSIFWKIRHLFVSLIPIFLIFFLVLFIIKIYQDSDLVTLSWEENKELFYYNFNAAFTSDGAHERAAQSLRSLPDDPFGYERRNRERTNDLKVLNIGFKMYQYRFGKLPVTQNPEPIKNGSRIYGALKTVMSHVPTDPLPVQENDNYFFDSREGFRYTIIMYFEEMGNNIQQERIKREYSNN